LNESVATSGGEGVTIAELLTEYDQSLTTMLEGQVFTVTGTLDPTDSQPSRGKLYWYVVEDGARLKVCIAEREGQLRGQRVQVTGRLRRNVWRPRGYLELVLYVTRITALEFPQEDWSGPLRAIGTQRQAAWPAVEQAIEHGIRAGMPPRGFCRKFRFWGKIQKSGINNSMTYRPQNSRKSKFATEPALLREAPQQLFPETCQQAQAVCWGLERHLEILVDVLPMLSVPHHHRPRQAEDEEPCHDPATHRRHGATSHLSLPRLRETDRSRPTWGAPPAP
jgi:hypothetical protein